MNHSDFKVEVPAKWVLSGEHSVLRGKSALAFPYPKMTLNLSYRASALGAGLTVTNNPFQSQIISLIARARDWLVRENFISPHHLATEGILEVEGSIPIGAGLGSSAALCVAVARFILWKEAPGQQDAEQVVTLATYLEDHFHGKSSGLDVRVTALSRPILFSLGGATPACGKPCNQEVLPITQYPRFELYDSGSRGATRECIERVEAWNQAHPSQVEALDDQMEEATEMARVALLSFEKNPVESEQRIARAMQMAEACFETWGLVPEALLRQKQELLAQGALAVKLTGAGLGGFWVALWPLDKQ